MVRVSHAQVVFGLRRQIRDLAPRRCTLVDDRPLLVIVDHAVLALSEFDDIIARAARWRCPPHRQRLVCQRQQLWHHTAAATAAACGRTSVAPRDQLRREVRSTTVCVHGADTEAVLLTPAQTRDFAPCLHPRIHLRE